MTHDVTFSSASGTAGTTSKTIFKLRVLSFYFVPKGHGEPPLGGSTINARLKLNALSLQTTSFNSRSDESTRRWLTSVHKTAGHRSLSTISKVNSHQVALPMSWRKPV